MGTVLEDKVALVTGGAARLGAQICRTLSNAGAIIAIHCHQSLAVAEDLVEEINAVGGDAFVVRGDLAIEEDRGALIKAVIKRAGRLDILVNNASIFEKSPLNEMTSEAARMMWKVNAEAPLMLIQHAAPHLRFEGIDQPGSVINILDNASGRSDWPEFSHYCASKAALLSMTRSLAQELAPSIRVNAVGPGAILFQDWESDDKRSTVLSSIPMLRQGTAEEIAETVLFLACGPSYITGQIINVDGGWSLT
jgi:pteridine reductase